MGSPISPVIANIYKEYLEEIPLGHEYPIPNPWWKRYMDDIISIVFKEQVDTFFNHLNSINPHIKFMMEAPRNVCSIPFLDTKCSPICLVLGRAMAQQPNTGICKIS